MLLASSRWSRINFRKLNQSNVGSIESWMRIQFVNKRHSGAWFYCLLVALENFIRLNTTQIAAALDGVMVYGISNTKTQYIIMLIALWKPFGFNHKYDYDDDGVPQSQTNNKMLLFYNFISMNFENGTNVSFVIVIHN